MVKINKLEWRNEYRFIPNALEIAMISDNYKADLSIKYAISYLKNKEEACITSVFSADQACKIFSGRPEELDSWASEKFRKLLKKYAPACVIDMNKKLAPDDTAMINKVAEYHSSLDENIIVGENPNERKTRMRDHFTKVFTTRGGNIKREKLVDFYIETERKIDNAPVQEATLF